MKILKAILLGLLAIGLVAVTGIFIFFQTFDADQHLPQLGRKVSAVLGRPVTIGELGLGISHRGGITLDVGPVIIADDPGFTSQPFIRIEKVRVSFDFKKLLHRQLRISGIVLQSPQIHFILNRDGHLNAASFLVPQTTSTSGVEVVPAPTASPPEVEVVPVSKAPMPRPAAVGLTSIKIVDGKISLIDQGPPFPPDIWIRNIKANITDFSRSKPFGLVLGASLYSNKRNVHIKASIMGLGKDDLAVDGNLHVQDVVLKDLNLMQILLSNALGNFLSGANVDNLFNGQWTAKDTVINSADVDFSFHNKALGLNSAVVKTNVFEFAAQGSLDQASQMDLQTVLHLDGQASSALIGQFDGLKLLCDDSGRITVPASLTGTWAHWKYKPAKDFRKKSTRALLQEGGNILGALLGGSSSGGQPSPGSGKKLKKNLTNMFKNLLQ